MYGQNGARLSILLLKYVKGWRNINCRIYSIVFSIIYFLGYSFLNIKVKYVRYYDRQACRLCIYKMMIFLWLGKRV